MMPIYIIEETIKENDDGSIDAKYIFYDRYMGRKWREDCITIKKDKLKEGKKVKKFGMSCIKLGGGR